jgi:ribosomal protein L7/L12
VLGANPIVFIGQDLALTDGKDHAEGYPHTYNANTLKNRTDNGFDADGYHGGRVRTERQLMYYKTWFERRASELTDRLIINATEGGARINGTVQLPFATVCREIQATRLRKTPLMPPTPTRIDPAHMAKLSHNLVTLCKDVQEFRKIATEARALCRRMGGRPSQKQLKRLDRLNQRIRQEDPISKTIVNLMGLKKFEAIRYKTHTGQGMDDIKDAIDKYDEVYQNIETGAETALKMLEDMGRFYQRVAERGEIALDLLDEIDPA